MMFRSKIVSNIGLSNNINKFSANKSLRSLINCNNRQYYAQRWTSSDINHNNNHNNKYKKVKYNKQINNKFIVAYAIFGGITFPLFDIITGGDYEDITEMSLLGMFVGTPAVLIFTSAYILSIPIKILGFIMKN